VKSEKARQFACITRIGPGQPPSDKVPIELNLFSVNFLESLLFFESAASGLFMEQPLWIENDWHT
jgi:hypothetical protein